MLAGYFWKSGRSWARELQNRSGTLLLPYVGWFIVVSAIFLSVGALDGPVSLNSLLPGLWGGSHAQGPFGTFWFISVFFFSVMLYRGVERLPRIVQAFLAIAGLALVYVNGEFLAGLPLGIGLAFPCLTFVLAGRILRLAEPRLTHPVISGVLLLFAAILAIAFIPQDYVDLKNGLFGTPGIGVMIAVSAGAGMILVARGVSLGIHTASLSVALGTVGIAVVLAHPVVIWAFRTHEVMPKWTLLAAVLLPWSVAMLLRVSPLSVILVDGRKVSSRYRNLASSRTSAR